VILAHSAQVTSALELETVRIPIVFLNVSDPIGAGFVKQILARQAEISPDCCKVTTTIKVGEQHEPRSSRAGATYSEADKRRSLR
jgi:ABC-type uncharacterized transport system substrate-binding protein